jgi:sugar lactone lactonase YvrE
MMDIECVVNDQNLTGEMPTWCPRTHLLWWIDVRKPAVYSWNPETKAKKTYPLPEKQAVGSFAFRERGGLLLALRDGLYGYDPASGKLDVLHNPEADKPDNRLNDGKCDRKGRFWLGSMLDTKREPKGSFYRFDADYRCTFQFNEIVIPNAVAFSPDDRTLYFGDTTKQMIWAFDFDLEDGVISNRRVFKDLTGQPGRPDGATVDAEGYLWNAEFNGKRIVRYAPDGRVDRVIEMPASNPTCCGFGGKNLDILFVTTSSGGYTPERRAAEPHAGGLLMLDVGVRGIAEPRFAG